MVFFQKLKEGRLFWEAHFTPFYFQLIRKNGWCSQACSLEGS